MTTRHSFVVELDVKLANPQVEITYDYLPGAPAYTPRGEYAPVDPPEPAEVNFVSARLVDGDGLSPTADQLNDWAIAWLNEDDGYQAAINHARR